MRRNSLLLLFSFFLINESFALSCHELLNKWQGNWIDEKHQLFSAKIEVTKVDAQKFHGQFQLSDGSTDIMNGHCIQINANEILIHLNKQAPFFNPCKGLMIAENQHLNLHFFCFNPNQSGFFVIKK